MGDGKNIRTRSKRRKVSVRKAGTDETLGEKMEIAPQFKKGDTTEDKERNSDREAWNAALASGDTDRIESARGAMCERINTRIMNDDENYTIAGWSK